MHGPFKKLFESKVIHEVTNFKSLEISLIQKDNKNLYNKTFTQMGAKTEKPLNISDIFYMQPSSMTNNQLTMLP